MIKKITNWGNYPVIEANQIYPANENQIIDYLKNPFSVIARGNERCYGDANLNENTLSTLNLNHLISLDAENGIIECESGVLLSDILETIVPKGFFLPVTPGTKFISVGGAVASDVHGKNHHIEGCFSDHVIELTLINYKGELITASPTQNQGIFWSTMGGMGLTGVITRIKFRLKKIESAFIKHEAIKAKNLDEIFSLFEESKNWTYTVAWIDCLQKNKHIGRSILFRGEHAKINELTDKQKENPLKPKSKINLTVPFMFPSFVLNTLSVKIFNFLYYHKQVKKQSKTSIDYDTFFYPLDIINDWNRIYGKNGFIQYQFVIPKKEGRRGMQEILQTISNSGQGSFLAVLKLFGKNNLKAYNSFPIEGYTLALDFKMTHHLPQLVAQLDDLVEQYGGRIYRAKDCMSKPSLLNYLKNTESTKFDSIQNKRINS